MPWVRNQSLQIIDSFFSFFALIHPLLMLNWSNASRADVQNSPLRLSLPLSGCLSLDSRWRPSSIHWLSLCRWYTLWLTIALLEWYGWPTIDGSTNSSVWLRLWPWLRLSLLTWYWWSSPSVVGYAWHLDLDVWLRNCNCSSRLLLVSPSCLWVLRSWLISLSWELRLSLGCAPRLLLLTYLCRTIWCKNFI